MGIMKRFKKGSLLSDSTIVIVASLLASLFSYIFQVYVGRALGPVEYGIFGSLVSLLYIFSVPAMTIQTTITKFVSKFNANGNESQIGTLILSAIKKISLYSFVGLLFFIISSEKIAQFFHISSRMPVILLGFMLVTSSVVPITMGALMGVQRFLAYSANSIAGAIVKLFFGVLLIFFGFGVNGALSSLIISNILVFFIGIVLLRNLFHDPKPIIRKEEIYRYSAPVLLTMLLLTAMHNIDMVLVKHFFPPEEAGYYAAASLLGKIIFFIAGPISFVMFPKASKEKTLKKKSAMLLRDSLFYTFVISLFGVSAYFINPVFIVSLLFGSKFIEVAPLIGLFGIAMAFYSLSNVIIMFNMAIKNMKFLFVLLPAFLLEGVMIVLFHHDLFTVVKIIALTMTSLFTLLLLLNKEEFVGPTPKIIH